MNRYINLSKYYVFQVWKSPILISSLVSFILVPIITILISYFCISKNLYYSSFIIAIIYQLYTFISLMLFTIKLFNENKYNLSDIKLLGKNYHRINLYLTKYLLILFIFIICNLVLSIITAIVMASLNQLSEVILSTIFSNFFGLFINVLFMLPLLILISIYFKRIWSPIISLLTILIFPFTSTISNLFLTSDNQNNNLQLNINNNEAVVTYNKIYKLDSNNKYLDSANVYSINYLSNSDINNNLDFDNNINYMNKFASLMPGNITLSAQQAIYSSIIKDTSKMISDYNKNKTSLVKLKSSNFKNVSSFLDVDSKYILTNIIDNNIFNLSSRELQKTILNDLIKIINKSEFKNIAKSEIELNSLSNTLFNNEIWSINNLDDTHLSFIFELLGSSASSLFYYWYYNDIFEANSGNLFSYLVKEANNQSLISFVEKLWTSYSTYLNIILLDNDQRLVSFKQLINDKYPINFSYNADLYPSKQDLDFFKKGLIVFKNSNIYILKNNGIYEIIDNNEFYKYFPTEIKDQESWIEYIVSVNIPTVQFLKNIYNTIQSFCQNLYDYRFSNNSFNLNSFESTFEITTAPYIVLWELWLTAELLLIFILFYLAWIIYKRSVLN